MRLIVMLCLVSLLILTKTQDTDLDQEEYDHQAFEDDYESLKVMLGEMEQYSGRLSGEDNEEELSNEELAKLTKILDDYEKKIKKITKNYKVDQLEDL